MRRFAFLLANLAIIVTGMVATFAPAAVNAVAGAQQICEGSGGTWAADGKAPNGGTCTSADKRSVVGTIKNVADVLIFITGAIAVVMVIVGGFRYVTSAGDQNGISSAKNTIMYALVGVVVATMAYAVVHFVLGALGIK